MTSTPKPTLSDDSELWTKSVSIVSALNDMTDALRKEMDDLQAANPDNFNPAGMNTLRNFRQALAAAHRDLAAELRFVARTNNLTFPQEL